MSWFPVDDAFHSHPKAIKAGDEAVGFWTRAGSFCMAYLTDGFVPEWWVKQQPKGMVKARRLVAADLWLHPVIKDGEQGFQFHQWKPECMKSHVLDVREKARLRKAKQRESQQESQRDEPCDEQRESHRLSGPTQPNPTQPINPLVDLGGGVTQVEPPKKCPRHVNQKGWVPEKCRGCADASREHKAWEDGELDRRRAAKEAHRQAIDACGLCDEFGDITFDDSVRKCVHRQVSHA